MNQVKIGKFIAESRKRKGFLQKDIAARLGLSKNRYIYLEQANMASKLLVWFEKHIDELNERATVLLKRNRSYFESLSF